jgi:hypothetical protein
VPISAGQKPGGRPERLTLPLLWLILALAGQAAALRLIDAGPLIHYQHYRLPPAPRWAATVLAFQFIIVASALYQRRSALLNGLRSLGRPWRIAAAAALSLCVAAALSRDQKLFLLEWSFAALIQFVNAGNILLAVWDFPPSGLRHFQIVFDRLLSRRGLVIGAAIWVTVVSAGLSWFVYQHHPHIADEVAYLYNARYFAAGEVVMPPPPLKEAFELDLMDYQPHQWFSAVPLGWPALLSVGQKLGAAWLVNPILAGLNVFLIYGLIGALYSDRIARLSVLLLCASPWYLFMAMSYMNHIATLSCALLAFWGISQARLASRPIAPLPSAPLSSAPSPSAATPLAPPPSAPSPSAPSPSAATPLAPPHSARPPSAPPVRAGAAFWALLAGFGVGAASLIRPLDGAIIGVLAAAWALGFGGARLGEAKLRFPALVALAAGTAFAGSLALPYNKALTGRATSSPLTVYQDKYYKPKSNAYGFGPERGLGWPIDPYPGHTPFEAVVLAELNGHSLNTDLFGWSTGSLFLVAAALFLGKLRRPDWMMIAIIAAVLLAYAPYWTNGGPDFGARYWFLIFPACVALSARGIEAFGGNRAYLAVAILCGLSLAVYVPWRSADKYYHYLRSRPDVRNFNFGRGVVFIRGDRFPDYMSAAIYNPLDLTANTKADAPVFVWDRSQEVHDQVLRLYPDWPVWVVDGPTRTGDGFRVVEAPR